MKYNNKYILIHLSVPELMFICKTHNTFIKGSTIYYNITILQWITNNNKNRTIMKIPGWFIERHGKIIDKKSIKWIKLLY